MMMKVITHSVAGGTGSGCGTRITGNKKCDINNKRNNKMFNDVPFLIVILSHLNKDLGLYIRTYVKTYIYMYAYIPLDV
jgi:hypothetical protein